MKDNIKKDERLLFILIRKDKCRKDLG